MAQKTARKCKNKDCGKSLRNAPPRAQFCSDKCRKEQRRRMQRARNDAFRERQAKDAINSLEPVGTAIATVLEPVVREALNEQTLQSVKDLFNLVPEAIERLRRDLDSEDDVIRQRAYQTIVRYTVGHPKLLDEKDQADTKLEVIFNIPRPADSVAVEAVEIRTCDFCGNEKPVNEFVGNSDRCRECYNEMREQADKILNG